MYRVATICPKFPIENPVDAMYRVATICPNFPIEKPCGRDVSRPYNQPEFIDYSLIHLSGKSKIFVLAASFSEPVPIAKPILTYRTIFHYLSNDFLLPIQPFSAYLQAKNTALPDLRILTR